MVVRLSMIITILISGSLLLNISCKKDTTVNAFKILGNTTEVNRNITNKTDTGIINTYNYIGYWANSCDSGVGSIDIERDNKIILEVNSNQIYLEGFLEKESRNNYVIKYNKVDVGRGGINLDWNNFVKDSAVINFELLSNEKMKYTWKGFYNSKSNKFEWVGTSDLSKNKDLIKCIF